MSRSHRRVFGGLIAAALALPLAGQAQKGAPATGEWRAYAADEGSTRYSALDQINATNFDKLEVAWRFKTDALGPRQEFNLQATPRCTLRGALSNRSPSFGRQVHSVSPVPAFAATTVRRGPAVK